MGVKEIASAPANAMRVPDTAQNRASARSAAQAAPAAGSTGASAAATPGDDGHDGYSDDDSGYSDDDAEDGGHEQGRKNGTEGEHGGAPCWVMLREI